MKTRKTTRQKMKIEADQKASESMDRLLKALPHVFVAMKMAEAKVPGGSVCLAVVAKKPDGSGQLTASFECEGFFNDILTILGLGTIDQFLEDQAILDMESVGKGEG